MKHLPEEKAYPHLVEFLRAGGSLEIGEDMSHGSFARLRIGKTTLNVVKPVYSDLAEVMREMDSQARRHLDERGRS